jgi:hypothetical protein
MSIAKAALPERNSDLKANEHYESRLSFQVDVIRKQHHPVNERQLVLSLSCRNAVYTKQKNIDKAHEGTIHRISCRLMCSPAAC